MDKIVDLINEKSDNKFPFLKTLSISYNKKALTCVISFLFPQTLNEISSNQKQIIYDILNNELHLNAKLILKFRKSYLDEELIHSKIMEFFKKNYSSLFSVIESEDISITIQGQFVDVLLKISSNYLNSFDKNNLLMELNEFLLKNFWAQFSFHFDEGRVLNIEEIEKKVNYEKEKKVEDIRFVPRYKVYDVSKIIGQEITPEPEFLQNINQPKTSVILAGKIENLNEFKYIRQKKGQDVEKTYFKFVLREKTGAKINCIYFCSKSNYDKFKKLVDGDEIVVVADISKDYKSLIGKVKSISLCQLPEKLSFNKVENVRQFACIKPEKIVTTSQKNLFTKDIKYDDNITKNTFVVFDVETTGLEVENSEIIEIGAVKIINGVLAEKFQTLVKPKQKINYLITDITGITNQMVENSPPIEHVIKDFYMFTKNCILSGYNVGFDMKFISKSGEEVGLIFDNEVQDVMALVRQKVRVGNYKLSTVVKALNIQLTDAHRAYNDAYATAKVLLKLSEINS